MAYVVRGWMQWLILFSRFLGFISLRAGSGDNILLSATVVMLTGYGFVRLYVSDVGALF